MAKTGFYNGFLSVVDGFSRARHASDTYSRLAALSDDQLARRSLSRGQIAQEAYRAAYLD